MHRFKLKVAVIVDKKISFSNLLKLPLKIEFGLYGLSGNMDFSAKYCSNYFDESDYQEVLSFNFSVFERFFSENRNLNAFYLSLP